jgi:hypothetical protein
MSFLTGVMSARRELLFVDREAELALFRDALSTEELKWNIFEIWGVGGIGKTFLLQRWLDICREKNLPAALIDARVTENHSISGFTQSVMNRLTQSEYKRFFKKYKQLLKEYREVRAEPPNVSPSTEAVVEPDDRHPLLDTRTALNQEFASALNAIADKCGRLVLAVDSFELLLGTSAERWLREFFIPYASAQILIIVSGRTRLGLEWEEWRPITFSIELQPFSADAARELLLRRIAPDYDESVVAETLQFAQGYPLALTLAAEVLKDKVGPPELPTTASKISTVLTERMTQSLDPPARVMLEALSILPTADEDILTYLLGDESVEVSAQLKSLYEFSFVRVTSQGSLQLHDAVKDFLAEGLRARSPSRYADLHQKASIYYLNRLDKIVGEGEWGGAAQEALKHRFAVDEVEGFKLFRKLFQFGLDLRYVTACRLLLYALREHTFDRGTLRSEANLLDTRLTTRLNQAENILANWEGRNSTSLVTNLAHLLGLVPVTAEQSDRYPGWAICTLYSTTLFRDTNLPAHLPILLYDGASLPGNAPQQVRAILEDYPSSHAQVALLMLYEGVIDESALYSLVAKVGQAYAYDLIPIQRDDLLEIVFSEEPQRALRRKVLSGVDLRSVSPFVINGPAPDNVFFGREDSLRELAEHITSGSYAVISGRRFGKTSILFRLHHVRLPVAGFRTVYHDCSTTPTYDAFLAATIRDWSPESPSEAPNTFGDLLESPPTEKPLVLLLDEADKLVPAERVSGWSLFNALRALANSGCAQIVLSGERTLRDVLRDPKSPLFNFANEIFLGPLDYPAVEELVTRPMKQLEIELVDEKAIVDRIWIFTSGHPNVVQRLCRRLIERLNEQGTRRITLDDVNAIIEDPAFQRDDFLSTYWEAATSLEKIISLLMADDESVRTLRAARQALAERCNLRPKAREVDDALQRLVDLRSILKRTPTGYEFAVEAFPRVVAGTMTLDDMLEVLTEDYAEEQAKGEA